MPSITKIVFSFIALYIVIGFYNFSSSGQFITPFFLNYFILLATAIYSFLVDRNANGSLLLALYAFAILSIASSHSITLSILNKWVGFSDYSTIVAYDIHKLISIIVFYSTLGYIHTKAIKLHQQNKWFWLPILFLIGSLLSVLLNLGFWQVLLLSAYLLSFILFSNTLNKDGNPIFLALVLQFVLFLVIENIRLLTTGV